MREDEILPYIYKFRRLNASQVATLFNANGWVHKVRSLLSHMAEKELLFRYHYPTNSSGFPPWMYELGKKGRAYLKKELGLTLFPPQDDEDVKYGPIMHDIYINDFLIAATKVPNVEVTDLRHDWLLHHTPIQLNGSDLRDYIIPDGFLHFHSFINGITDDTDVWLELDRGTQTNPSYFKLKIRSILAGIYTKECEELFSLKRNSGYPVITIAFATTGSEKRLKTIREWTMQELTKLGREEDSMFFLFTRLPHKLKKGIETDELDLSPQLFLDKVWYTPSEDEPVSLLDLS